MNTQHNERGNTMKNMNLIVVSFLETLLWSEHSSEDKSKDFTDLGIEDFSYEALYEAQRCVIDFISDERIAPVLHTIEYEAPSNMIMVGHDLALTMNRHGAGFWDRGFGKIGELLTEVAQDLGEIHLYIHENKIEVEY